LFFCRCGLLIRAVRTVSFLFPFANSIGADSYFRDAAVAVETVKQYMVKRQGSALAARACAATLPPRLGRRHSGMT